MKFRIILKSGKTEHRKIVSAFNRFDRTFVIHESRECALGEWSNGGYACSDYATGRCVTLFPAANPGSVLVTAEARLTEKVKDTSDFIAEISKHEVINKQPVKQKYF